MATVVAESGASFRAHKCKALIHRSEVYDDRVQDTLRRFCVFPGLGDAERADMWNILLGVQTTIRDLWKFTDTQRREAYDALLLNAMKVLDGEPEDPVLIALRMYSVVSSGRLKTGALSTSAPRLSSLKNGIDEEELGSIRAMRTVLSHVFERDGKVQDHLVFWGLVMLTTQQNRVLMSSNGRFLQSYGTSQRVHAFSVALARDNPDTCDLLERQLGIAASEYADTWFRSLFAVPLLRSGVEKERLEAIARLWDALIASPFELVVHVAVRFVRRMKAPIMETMARRYSGEFPDIKLKVLDILDTLPGINLAAVNEILHNVWSNTRTLFRPGTRLTDLHNRIWFAVRWPILERGTVNSDLVRVCQFLLRAHGLGSILFVGECGVV